MMKSLYDNIIGKDLKLWTFQDVEKFLTNMQLDQYIEAFRENHITGKNILDLNDSELKDDLNIIPLGHRKIFLKGQTILRKCYT